MGKAIIRMQKLKSPVAVRRSMKHAFREQDTPNADPERTPDNTHIGARDVAEAMQRFNAALPDKVRKNAVLAVEYLVTASPESMKDKTREQQDAYFSDSLEWLRRKHGAENVIYAGIHRDETTPHMYAYVLPKDERGKLNCRSFYGEKDSLSKMQTDFAQQVGYKHGLERGIEGSKARHTSIRQYYARVNAETPKTPSIDLPEAKLLESKETYGRRVADLVLKKIQPELLTLRAKAKNADLAQQQAKAAQATLEHQGKIIHAQRKEVERLDGMNKTFIRVITSGGATLEHLHQEYRKKHQQSQEIRQEKRDKDLSR